MIFHFLNECDGIVLLWYRAAHEVGAATAIVNIGVTRADDIVPLKINARIGEVHSLFCLPISTV